MAQIINLAAGSFSNVGGLVSNVSIAMRAQIENAIGGSGQDQISGNAFDNRIAGGAGIDTLVGLGGNDTFVLAASNNGLDQIDGGSGTDTLDFSTQLTYAWVDLAYNGVEAWTFVNNVWVTVANTISVENVLGSVFGDRLVGGAEDNVFIGGSGADVLSGRGGNDTFIYIGAGNGLDQVDGGTGFDTLDFAGLSTYAWVDLAYNGIEAWTQVSGAWVSIANTVANSIESVVGTAFADKVWGDAQANTFKSLAGADALQGRAGADTFIFTDGNGLDQIDGGTETDTLDFSQLSTYAWVDLGVPGSGGIEAWTLVGTTWQQIGNTIAVENMVGTVFADRLAGDAQANTINGRGGDDTLYGRAGNDVFRYDTLGFGRDRVLDYTDNADRLSFSLAVADSFADDFTITGNGSLNVLVTLKVDGSSIALTSTSAINLTSADFDFIL
jgi:Ca2+-binding RTX toxin-like protein